MDSEDCGWPEQEPPSIDCPAHNLPCLIFNLPIELRNKMYRCFVISRLDCRSHPRLWRPLGVDGGITRKIGYFAKDTVISLLLICQEIHEEAAAILYGENTFSFHISGLSEGPLAFLEWLAPKYVRLLRKVYIRTGYHVETNFYQQESTRLDSRYVEPTAELMRITASRNLSISVALMKQAWPAKYKVFINKSDTIEYSSRSDTGILQKQAGNDWPSSSYHMWKMFVTDPQEENPTREFRRIIWDDWER